MTIENSDYFDTLIKDAKKSCTVSEKILEILLRTKKRNDQARIERAYENNIDDDIGVWPNKGLTTVEEEHKEINPLSTISLFPGTKSVPYLQWNETYPEYDVEEEVIKLTFFEKFKKMIKKDNNDCEYCDYCGQKW